MRMRSLEQSVHISSCGAPIKTTNCAEAHSTQEFKASLGYSEFETSPNAIFIISKNETKNPVIESHFTS